MKHILHKDISGSSEHIGVHLIGVGGTGSHVLTNLAMINSALIRIERQPLMVTAFDMDHVTQANIGRQGFSPADIWENKAKVMVERINRYFGFQWDYYPSSYNMHTDNRGRFVSPSIIISCVDSVKSRLQILENIEARSAYKYWMDIGNDRRTAQIILGAPPADRGSGKKQQILPNFFEEFPGIKDKPEDDIIPSCSAMESLNRQDLFINKITASFATHMLWTLLKDFMIDYRGLYINLETMQINKIPIV